MSCNPTKAEAVKHNPTPWKWIAWGQTISIGSEKGWWGIALINPNGISNAGIPARQDRENAKFIVRAANCHDELLLAVKLLLEYMEDPDSTIETAEKAIDAAYAAVAKAEGRKYVSEST
jgi:hypothetical protein